MQEKGEEGEEEEDKKGKEKIKNRDSLALCGECNAVCNKFRLSMCVPGNWLTRAHALNRSLT